MLTTLKISFASTVIGFVGSIFPYHGVDVLIRCFASIVQDSQQDLCLLIVGDGETLPALKDLAEQLKMRDQILFTGNIPHHRVMPYIQAMDICVMAKSNW
jgi:glycosyltransferase involved in cell wall biosynthesis